MPTPDPAPKQRVTQTDVARAAGVHNTTVSLCLRNCGSIPEATRKRIQTLAAEMGYYPDPTLQALVAYRKGKATSRAKEILGYVTNGDTRWGWRENHAEESLYIGAQNQAGKLGYQLEHFWLREPGMNGRRLSQILYHRGISGVLLANQDEQGSGFSELDFAHLSAVAVGGLVGCPQIHGVCDDHRGMVRMALKRICEAGYQRVGFVTSDAWDARSDRSWTAGILSEQAAFGTGRQIPFFRVHADPKAGITQAQRMVDLAGLSHWVRSHKPEVIVGFAPSVRAQLEALGLCIPRDLAYVDLCLDGSGMHHAGVRQNGEQAGEVATTLLVSQVQKSAFGLPQVATTTLINGHWVDGASMPKASTRFNVDCDVETRSSRSREPMLVSA